MIPKAIDKGLNLRFDRDLLLSDSQVIDSTSDVASTNAIVMGSTNFTKATPMKVNVFIEALVGTLVIKVCGKAGSAPAATDILETINVAAGLTGIVSATLNQTEEVDYIKLFYTAGTSATLSAAMTSTQR